MSDPYAAALGIADAPAAGQNAAPSPSPADWAAVSAKQRYTKDSLNIATDEVGQAKTPGDRAAALREQSRIQARLGQQGGAAAANDPYADALGLGAHAPAPTQAAAYAAAPAKAGAAADMPPMPPKEDLVDKPKPGSDPYSDALYAKTGSGHYERPGESWWDTYARNARYDQMMRDANLRQAPNTLKILANAGSSIGGSIAGGLHGLAKLVTGGSSDENGDAVRTTQQALTYTPQDPESRAMINAASGPLNPLNWPAMAGDVGGNWLAEHGMPGTGAAVATAGAAVPMLLGMKPGTRAAVGNATRNVGSTLADLKRPPAPPMPRVEPTIEAVPNNPTPTLSQVAPGVPEANLSLAPKDAVPGRSEPLPGGLAPIKPAPEPTFSDAANNVFAANAPDVPGGLPAAEQARRQAVLQEIGLNQVRRSAITGDASQAAVDFQTSRLKGSPGGDAMSQQLASEKQAIADYADGVAQRTGGTTLNDQSAKYSRGGTIMQPLEGLNDYFNAQSKQLYDTAAERAGGVPTQLDKFRTVLGDDSLATNSDKVQMRQAIQSYAQKLNIIREDGSIFSDGNQAEAMRQYLTEHWSPQNATLINKLKGALDQDVIGSAGEDVYANARGMWSLKKNTLENPNGVGKLMDSSGPNGINRAVPVEKVPDFVANMPVDQLKNLTDTYKGMVKNEALPPALRGQASEALSEIKAQFANNVRELGSNQTGQWNAKSVRKYLSANSQRMATVFNSDEMKQFGTLNDAGNILAKDQSYPGAFAQQQNLLRAGVTHAITGGATAAGGAIGGPFGSVVGSVMGGKLAGKMNDASTLRATQKRMVTLSNLTSGGDQ